MGTDSFMVKGTGSRKKPKVGDLFSLLMVDGLYAFGRVISDSARYDSFSEEPGLALYFYRFRSAEAVVPPIEERLVANDVLAIPPELCGPEGWSMGFYRTVENVPLVEGEVLAQHCFRVPPFRDDFHEYVDEHNNRLPGPVEPCGVQALGSCFVAGQALGDVFGLADDHQVGAGTSGEGQAPTSIMVPGSATFDVGHVEELVELLGGLMDGGVEVVGHEIALDAGGAEVFLEFDGESEGMAELKSLLDELRSFLADWDLPEP